jgi:hypothetical protein
MKTFFPLFLILFLLGCGGNQPTTPSPDTAGSPPPAESGEGAVETPAKAGHPILGSYVGLFEAKTYNANQNISWSNKITVFLDSITGDQLFGHSVVAGNARPFIGTLRKQGDQFVAEGSEPGDDQYDGRFAMTIDAGGKTINGTWRANKKLGVSERQYSLTRRSFRYDPQPGIARRNGLGRPVQQLRRKDRQSGVFDRRRHQVQRLYPPAEKRRGGKYVQIRLGSDP